MNPRSCGSAANFLATLAGIDRGGLLGAGEALAAKIRVWLQ